MEKIAEKIAGYQDFKQALDQELQQAAEGFVKIGFLLRLAMETDILRGSGYRDVYEFADREYSLDKSQVSRFININIRFSEDGHSDRLQARYRGYGYAKLAVMLQLPDALLGELSPAFSKSEIQKIHEEVKEERRTSDIEIWLEGAQVQQEEAQRQQEMAKQREMAQQQEAAGQQEASRQEGEADSSLLQVMRQLCRNEMGIYRELHKGYAPDGERKRVARAFQETLAPAGEAIYSVRIPGVGRLMLSMKGVEQPVSVIHVRSNEKEVFSWPDLVDAFSCLYQEKPWRESWEGVFQEALPEGETEAGKVAPVQLQEEKKPAAKKKPKVQAIEEKPKRIPIPEPEPAQKTETEQKEECQEKPAEEGKPSEKRVLEDKQSLESVTERQTSIERDFKEVLPDGYEISQVQAETETEHWEAITSGIHQFQRELSSPEQERDPRGLLKKGREILEELERILRLRGE